LEAQTKQQESLVGKRNIAMSQLYKAESNTLFWCHGYPKEPSLKSRKCI